ncbi:Prophage side tail fiber protein like [Actinidia chinensis var. chinensis]|uniref:Prophage side tail fiber protein like n=1 Tax=Actinidia chinensis var. chinensis TaxID=1590841 RepID=A0A2R6PRF0_ACTCC|nr:Prophage side tail fiber protein like [Actinidia chinensis var. chinensis]
MAIDLLPEPTYEERSEKMVTHKEANPALRIARFVKPIAKNVSDAVRIPKTPLLSDIFSHNLQNWPSKVNFQGWKRPQKKWKQWVEHLAGKYCTVWEKAGICDAILSSVFEVHGNHDLVLGLSEFWCPETNTFVFPWGEATITLEDIAVLGGYVFPSSDKAIGKHVFPIAGHLSRGTKLALAPAVLSSLYRDLSLVREKAMNGFFPIAVSAPFQLLQLWAFERFPLLGPKTPNPLEPGQPRAARWHSLSSKTNLPLVRIALVLADNFMWRPYAADLENWRHLSHYKKTEQFVTDCSGLGDDDGLRSFVWALQPCELVGVNCREKYLPHRVARQFGMDQDLPGDCSGSINTGLKRSFSFFVPSREFKPGVSVRYLKWWEDVMLAREDAIKDVLERKGNTKKGESSVKQKIEKTNCNGRVPEFPSKAKARIIRDCSDEAGLRPVSLPIVANKATGISEKLPLHGSTLKSPEKIFQVSSCGAANQASGISVKSPFTEAKNSKGDWHASIGLRTLEGSKRISEVSLCGVENKAADISEKSPFTEAKNSKGNWRASVGSRTLDSSKKISEDSLCGVAKKAAGISEKSPFTEAKNSEGDCRASVGSRTLENSKKTSEVASCGVAKKAAGISEKPKFTEAKNSQGDCRASVGSRTLENSKKISEVTSCSVAKKATGISEKSKFTEAKNSKGDCCASVGSGILKSPMRISHVASCGDATKATGISKKSPSTEAGNGKGDYHASVGSRTMQGPKKCTSGKRQESVPHHSKIKLQSYEDLSDEDVRFKPHSGVRESTSSLRKACTGNLPQNAVSSTPRSSFNENFRKQESYMKTEGKLQNKVSIARASYSANDQKVDDAREAKRKVGDSSSDFDPLDFVLLSERERIKRSKTRESSKGVTGDGEIRKGGESFNNPIIIDGHMESRASKIGADGLNLEQEARILRIEKMLGISPG